MVFQKGNTASKGRGRPHKGKNILPTIRDAVLNEAYQRIKSKKFFKDVTNQRLIDFVERVLPKETNLKISPDIQYISSVPRQELGHERPQLELQAESIIEAEMNEETKTVSSEEWVPIEETNE